jgi:predicted peptidase
MAAATAAAALVIALPQLTHVLGDAEAEGVARDRVHAPPSPVPARVATSGATRQSTPGRFSARTFTDRGVTLHYQVFFPHDYDQNKQWPVIVALHGSGEKGSDGVKQIGVGMGPLVKAQAETFPAVVVFPQVPASEQGHVWVPALMRLIDAAVAEVNGDSTRVYLTGLSFGGLLAYNLAYGYPDRFAALVPVSAYVVMQGSKRYTKLPQAEADAREAQALRTTPVWIFHGERDSAIPVAKVRDLVTTLKAAGVPVRYTEYADTPHDSWNRAYRTPELWTWLLAQHR